MGKQSTLRAIETPQPTPEERAVQCEKGLAELCQSLNLTPVVCQVMIDGQLVPVRNVPLKLVFIPNENLKQEGK